MHIKHTRDTIIDKANQKHNNRYNYVLFKEYISYVQYIDIICESHGIFNQKIRNHLSGQGCPKCIKNRKKTFDEYIVLASIKHNNFYNYSLIDAKTYKNTKIKIICPKHGIFEQKKENHLFGQNCPKCAKVLSQVKIKTHAY